MRTWMGLTLLEWAVIILISLVFTSISIGTSKKVDMDLSSGFYVHSVSELDLAVSKGYECSRKAGEYFCYRPQ